VIHLELRVDFRVGQDVSAGDAVLRGAVAPRVRVRVSVSVGEQNIHNVKTF
jgi:hypothetical protein